MANIYQAVNILKFKNVEILGSASDLDLKYFSDIDLQEKIVTNNSPKNLVDWFQKKIKELHNIPNVYFQELKAGFYRHIPLKWNYKQVEQGYQFKDGLKITLESIFILNSIIKIDFIVYQGGEFLEVSINYYFEFSNTGNKTYDTEVTKQEIGRILLFEYQKLKSKDFYKSLKRLYSYYKLINDKTAVNDMRKVFNSKLGFLNKQLSNMKTIKELIDWGFIDEETRKRVIKTLSNIEYNILLKN